jgi:hypothetical protein
MSTLSLRKPLSEARPALAAKVQAKKPILTVVNPSLNPKASWVRVVPETMTLDYFFDEYLEIEMPERERNRMGYVLAAWAVKAGRPKVTEMSKLGFEVRVHKTKTIERLFKGWAKPNIHLGGNLTGQTQNSFL